MRHSLLSSLIVLALTAPADAATPSASPAELQAAIQRAIGALTEDGKGWMTARKCASCHHAPFMLWALHDAKRRGYKVDGTVLGEVTSWVLAPNDAAKIFPPQP